MWRFDVRPPLSPAGAPWRVAASGLSELGGEGSPFILKPLDKIQSNEKTHLYSGYDDGIQRINC